MTSNKTALVGTIILVVLCIILSQPALAAPVISVIPSQQTVWQGDNVTVNVTVGPMGSEVMGAQYDLYFDPLLLNATEQVSGSFLSQDGATTMVVTNEFNNTLGLVGYGETRMGIDYGVIDSGTLATITFKAMEAGTSSLSLSNVLLSDPLGGSISGILVNGGTVEIKGTHFNISGSVTYEDGTPVYNPNVTITNLNTGEVMRADANGSSNYYQLLTNFAHVGAGDELQFYVTDDIGNATQVNHEVSQAEMDVGGFVQNFTLYPPDLTPPLITNVSGVSTGKDSVVIAWETDEPSDSVVKYGTQPETYIETASNASYVMQHSFTIAGLRPNTTYYFVVNSTDPSSNAAQSPEYNVTTFAEIFISIGNASTLAGEIVTIPIVIRNIINVGIVDIRLEYNQSVVHVIAVDESDFDFMDASIDNASGVTRIGAYQIASAGLNEQVRVANVTLQAVGNGGEASVLGIRVLELKEAGPEENTIPVTVENGTFSITELTPPVATNPTANPACIPEDTDSDPRWGETSLLNVTVTDDCGVASVVINLSALGGSPEQSMTRIPGTDVWTVTIRAAEGSALCINESYILHNLTITATDIFGNANASTQIQVTAMRNGDVSENGEVSLYDAMYLAKHLLGKPEFEAMNEAIGEVSGNDAVTLYDAMYLSKHVLGESGFELLH
ncbi:MAG: fibronectin type III domain-containing protein [Methanomicrobia archaeon]|nr:fibronectin type III domain-containing protein [Methanomicrobia archaeon]